MAVTALRPTSDAGFGLWNESGTRIESGFEPEIDPERVKGAHRAPSVTEDQSHMPLPPEQGTIEFRTDGSVTVAGHRVRLARVFQVLKKGDESLSRLACEFPSVERPLLMRVLLYIARHERRVKEFVAEQEELSAHHLAGTRRLSLDDLRQMRAK